MAQTFISLLQSALLILFGIFIGFEFHTDIKNMQWIRSLTQYSGKAKAKDLNMGTLSYLETLATQGNIKDQLRLAEIYETGDGVPKDDETALQLYKAIAEQAINRLKKENSALF